jgi:hypothetical protein
MRESIMKCAGASASENAEEKGEFERAGDSPAKLGLGIVRA